MAGRRFRAVGRFDPDAITSDDEGDFGGSVPSCTERCLAPACLFIMDGLLANAEDFEFHAGGMGQRADEAEGRFDAVPVGMLGYTAKFYGEGAFSSVLGTKGPDGLAGFGKALADVLAGGVEVTDGGVSLVVSQEFGDDLKLDGDPDVALGEGVVYFAGDAVALGEDNIELALGSEEAEAKRDEYEGGGEGDEEQIEPERLIEVRLELVAKDAPVLFQMPSLFAA